MDDKIYTRSTQHVYHIVHTTQGSATLVGLWVHFGHHCHIHLVHQFQSSTHCPLTVLAHPQWHAYHSSLLQHWLHLLYLSHILSYSVSCTFPAGFIDAGIEGKKKFMIHILSACGSLLLLLVVFDKIELLIFCA